MVALSFFLLSLTVILTHNCFCTCMEHQEYPNLMGNGMNMPRGLPSNVQGSSYVPNQHTITKSHQNPHMQDYLVCQSLNNDPICA